MDDRQQNHLEYGIICAYTQQLICDGRYGGSSRVVAIYLFPPGKNCLVELYVLGGEAIHR